MAKPKTAREEARELLVNLGEVAGRSYRNATDGSGYSGFEILSDAVAGAPKLVEGFRGLNKVKPEAIEPEELEEDIRAGIEAFEREAREEADEDTETIIRCFAGAIWALVRKIARKRASKE